MAAFRSGTTAAHGTRKKRSAPFCRTHSCIFALLGAMEKHHRHLPYYSQCLARKTNLKNGLGNPWETPYPL